MSKSKQNCENSVAKLLHATYCLYYESSFYREVVSVIDVRELAGQLFQEDKKAYLGSNAVVKKEFDNFNILRGQRP